MSRTTEIQNILKFLIVLLLSGVFLFPIIGSAYAVGSYRADVPQGLSRHPTKGWLWEYGPLLPRVSESAQRSLGDIGINAVVLARNYGEKDNFGNFFPAETHFLVKLLSTPYGERTTADLIRKQVRGSTHLRVGNIRVIFADGSTLVTRGKRNLRRSVPHFLNTPGSIKGSTVKKVYVIVYDPLLSNGQLLSEYLHWNSYKDLTNQTINFFRQASHGEIVYSVVATSVVTDGWPAKIDGFRYTEEEYLAVYNGQSNPHTPDTVDYNKIVNSPDLDICGKANRGEIDEVWIYNGPWFGFYESTLVGPGAYWYNSTPVPKPYTCNRLVPIMGPSPHVGVDYEIHDFGHRTEATMKKVYGVWDSSNPVHNNWEKFTLVKSLAAGYSYSGCGNVHYPPNGVTDYDYSNSSTVMSNCDDFANYPNLHDPQTVLKPVSCSNWGCDQFGYLSFWFSHLPSNPGCGSDMVASDWWKYFSDPALALNPSAPCGAQPAPSTEKVYMPVIIIKNF